MYVHVTTSFGELRHYLYTVKPLNSTPSVPVFFPLFGGVHYSEGANF